MGTQRLARHRQQGADICGDCDDHGKLWTELSKTKERIPYSDKLRQHPTFTMKIFYLMECLNGRMYGLTTDFEEGSRFANNRRIHKARSDCH